MFAALSDGTMVAPVHHGRKALRALGRAQRRRCAPALLAQPASRVMREKADVEYALGGEALP